MDLADRLMDSLRDSVDYLDRLTSPMPKVGRAGAAFHH
jgi:hypothetical protein